MLDRKQGGDEENGKISLRLNLKQFNQTPVHYATITNVGFDGINFLVSFFVTSPDLGGGPMDPENVDAQCIARLALPGPAAFTLMEDIRSELANTESRGIFDSEALATLLGMVVDSDEVDDDLEQE